jgi:Uma2 family endonuclease
VDTLTNPTLLIEVLSPSTESYDRGTKAKLYRAIPSLKELLLVSQNTADVDFYRRCQGAWMLIEAKRLDSVLRLESIQYDLRLRDVYDGVPLDQSSAEAARR